VCRAQKGDSKPLNISVKELIYMLKVKLLFRQAGVEPRQQMVIAINDYHI
jgi:hypothetical protein